MASVSLIVLHSLDAEHPIVEAARGVLYAEGHTVDVRLMEIESHGGTVGAALAGLRQAQGSILVVLDARRGYGAEDIIRVIAPIARGESDLVVGCRSGLRVLPGAIVRRLVGTNGPLSGLLAIDAGTWDHADSTVETVGTWFAPELLSKLGGRWSDVGLDSTEPAGSPWLRFGYEDIRHIKHLSDHRFGNASRLLQFCLVGASGMVVDLTSYAALQVVLSRSALAGRTAPLVGGPLDLAAAGGLAILMALIWNFSLNRRLTFNDARHGSIARQFATYVLSNALGVTLSFTLRLWLPRQFGFFARHKLAAAVVGIVSATGITFSMARWLVFRTPQPETPEPPVLAEASSAS